MSLKKILVAEDDSSLGELLSERLALEYDITWVKSKSDALLKLNSMDFDLAILDIGLPDGSGFEIARAIKGPTRIIFLTAQSDAESRLQGFELGAEEYIPKPFHMKELFLRIQHVFNEHKVNSETWTFQGISIDFVSMSVKYQSGVIEYPARSDLKILKLLLKKSPEVVTRDQIMDYVWGEDKSVNIRSIDNAIVRIKKMLLLNNEDFLRNVRGQGYQWAQQEGIA